MVYMRPHCSLHLIFTIAYFCVSVSFRCYFAADAVVFPDRGAVRSDQCLLPQRCKNLQRSRIQDHRDQRNLSMWRSSSSTRSSYWMMELIFLCLKQNPATLLRKLIPAVWIQSVVADGRSH
ncbi:hypothetical protein GOODEAATRI_033782 [Goodea atripinnis]|uniref:Secreted protein n=1 Tax=Goodea atripinnis TaxID=208336 RepID=A0ABV0P9V5_9TELE